MLDAPSRPTRIAAPPPPPANTRRVSAGITPAPGATSSTPAWWGADDWLEVEVRAALIEHPELCRAHHVHSDTVLAVARGMAAYADHTTGRDCRPTNARLVEVLRMSLSTVQRARRVLKALGLVVELVAGRSIMTRAERLSAWRRGSAHRQIAAEFALCSRRQRRTLPRRTTRPKRRGRRDAGPGNTHPGATKITGGRGASVDGDTPPGALAERTFSPVSNTHLQATTEQKKAASRPASTSKVDQDQLQWGDSGVAGAPGRAATTPPPPERDRRVVGRPHPATRRLADATRTRLGWLAGTSARRIAPTLHRFAQAGWTPRDVERAVTDALATRGWRLPRQITHPAAYLATLLRPLDPADRPGALDAHIAAVEADQRRYEKLLVFGRPCAHGTPAGDVPSPLRGSLACPSCRTVH